MKFFQLFILFSFSVLSLKSQQNFIKRIPYGMRGYTISQTLNDDFLIVGSQRQGVSNYNGMVLKMDSGLNVLWSFRIGGNNEIFWGCDLTSDTGYIISGRTEILSKTANYVLKLDSLGNKQWEKIYYDTGSFVFNAGIKALPNNHSILFGSKRIVYGYNPFMMELDENGNIIWQRGFLIDSFISNYAKKLFLDDNAFLFIVGSNQLIKTDLSGNVMWHKEYTDAYGLEISDLSISSNNDYILAYTFQDSAFRRSTGIMSLDTSGDILWNNRYIPLYGQLDQLPFLCKTPNHGYYFVSEFLPDAIMAQMSYYSLILIDSIGRLISAKRIEFDNYENIPREVILTSDGCGLLLGSPAFVPSIDIIKFESTDNILCSEFLPINVSSDSISVNIVYGSNFSGINDSDIVLSKTLLSPNAFNFCSTVATDFPAGQKDKMILSPNPTNRVFTIKFDSYIVQGRIEILNTLGDILYTLEINGNEQFINESLFPGIYIIRITDREFRYMKKLIIQ